MSPTLPHFSVFCQQGDLLLIYRVSAWLVHLDCAFLWTRTLCVVGGGCVSRLGGAGGRGYLVVAWPGRRRPPFPALGRSLPPATKRKARCSSALTSPAPPAPAFIVGPHAFLLHGAPGAAADPGSGTGPGPHRDPSGARQVALPDGAATQPPPGSPTRVSPSGSVVGGARTGR